MVRQRKFTRLLSGLGALVLLIGVGIQVLLSSPAFALISPITNRSLTLEGAPSVAVSDVDGDGIPDGGSMPGAKVEHLFNFTLTNTAASIGSITFQYCTTGEPVNGGIGCNAPTGINVAGATLTQDSGGAIGFTTVATSSQCDSACGIVNTVTIERAAASAPTSAALTKELSGIVNPTTANKTFYVRISTYASLNGTGTPDNAGTVAASTANPIYLSGTMPESLVFCTGQSISETNNVPDCSTATAGNVSFNQLFSPQSTSWATSQMAASTNATSGYVITVNGPTLTSGSNTITAINAAGGALSAPGTSQFGMNVVLDTDANSATPAPVPASANVTTPAGGTLYNGAAVAPYNTGGSASAAKFEYNSGDTVANSTGAGSDAQVFTSTYMVNVPGHQPAGTYVTTLTYICTATF